MRLLDYTVMRNLVSLFVLLALLWLALSGVYKPLLIGLGLLSVGFALWISRRMDVIGDENNPGLFSWRLPVYWAWLVWQIALSNLHVARLVFSPGRISPQVMKMPVRQASDAGKVTFANSVTLTPGTVTLALEGDELTVHALDDQAADELRREGMGDKVRWLEGEA